MRNKSYTSIFYPENRAADIYAEQFCKFVHKKYFKKSGKLLDIGCGRGRYLKGFKLLGYDIKGVDVDDEAVKICRKKNFEVKQVDLNEDKIPDNEKFDFIFSRSVIEHMERKAIDFLLDQIHDLIEPDGKVLLITPCWEKAYKIFYDDPTHKTPFTKTGIRRKLLLHNFKIIEIAGFRGIPYIWRFSYGVFNFLFPTYKEMIVVFKENEK